MIGKIVTKRLALSVFVGGILLALVGFWWLWSGLDIVQIERGWSAVIAGATIMSTGFVIMALAGVIAVLRRIADHLALGVTSAEPHPVLEERPSSAFSATVTDGHTRDADSARPDRQIVGRHVSGGATYVMFSDGSVEAQTPDGIQQFSSLEALRAYVDEREAAGR